MSRCFIASSLSVLYRLSARQRSGGSVSQTSVPFAIEGSVEGREPKNSEWSADVRFGAAGSSRT
jgi:hypothetical protein